jgi:hypothetical protein
LVLCRRHRLGHSLGRAPLSQEGLDVGLGVGLLGAPRCRLQPVLRLDARHHLVDERTLGGKVGLCLALQLQALL